MKPPYLELTKKELERIGKLLDADMVRTRSNELNKLQELHALRRKINRIIRWVTRNG